MSDLLYVNGDSWTWGSELIAPGLSSDLDPTNDAYRLEHRWVNRLGRHMNLPVVDGSGAGASNDRIVRTTVQQVLDLVNQGHRPFVVIAWTQLHRFELYGKNGYQTFNNPRDTTNPRIAKEMWRAWSNDTSDCERWLQQVVLLESFFKNLGLSFYMAITFDQIQRTVNNLMHTGTVHAMHRDFIKTLWNHTSFSKKAQQAHDIIAKGTNFGPNRHPLAEGHELIANYIIQDQAWPETKGNI